MQNQFGNCDSVRYPAIWWMTSVRIGINSQLSSILRTFSSDLKTENLTEYSGIPYRLFWDFRADNTFTTSWSSCRVTSARVQVWVTVTIFKAWAVIAVNNNSTDMGISGSSRLPVVPDNHKYMDSYFLKNTLAKLSVLE